MLQTSPHSLCWCSCRRKGETCLLFILFSSPDGEMEVQRGMDWLDGSEGKIGLWKCEQLGGSWCCWWYQGLKHGHKRAWEREKRMKLSHSWSEGNRSIYRWVTRPQVGSGEWRSGESGSDGDALEGFVWEAGRALRNAITFISLRMNDEPLSVRIALYTCSWSRTIFRCFMDTILSATAMPCKSGIASTSCHSKELARHPLCSPKPRDLERGRERKGKKKKWRENLVPLTWTT